MTQRSQNNKSVKEGWLLLSCDTDNVSPRTLFRTPRLTGIDNYAVRKVGILVSLNLQNYNDGIIATESAWQVTHTNPELTMSCVPGIYNITGLKS